MIKEGLSERQGEGVGESGSGEFVGKVAREGGEDGYPGSED